jgi:hypothetical protein
MNGITVLVALAAVGVDYGWQPGADGQLEYIVQIEPSLLDSLRSGKEIASEIHPDARGVRRFRIRVGTGTLPRIGVLAPGTAPTRLSTSNAVPPALDGSAFAAPPSSGFPQSNNSRGTTISDEPLYTAPSSSGILNLPPPPALIGPDGKASVLVRPGDRALPSIAPPANSGLPTYDAAPPGSGAAGSLNVPTPPPAGAGGWQLPDSPVSPGDSDRGVIYPASPNGSPGLFGPPSPAGVYPVPAPGPETGFPEPVRSSGMNQNNRSSAEKTVANELDERKTATDLLSQLAESQDEAAVQKPTIDKETAERLKAMQAAHPWAPLVLTSLALFGSLAANAYLGWIATGIYRRYRDMCDELHEAQASLT